MIYKLRKGGKIVRVTENELAKYITKGYVEVKDKEAEVQKAPRNPESDNKPKSQENKRKASKE